MTTVQFPIVGIGASAGGIDAFRAFFSHMPADSGMAFIVILHLPAEHKSMLSDILSRWTSMSVVDATDGTPIKANHVYVPPPQGIVTVVDRCLGVKTPEDNDRVHHPIDGFFDSLGTAIGERAVGIVLSGTGSDGALGLKALRGAPRTAHDALGLGLGCRPGSSGGHEQASDCASPRDSCIDGQVGHTEGDDTRAE